jgi:hypothetical protein
VGTETPRSPTAAQTLDDGDDPSVQPARARHLSTQQSLSITSSTSLSATCSHRPGKTLERRGRVRLGTPNPPHQRRSGYGNHPNRPGAPERVPSRQVERFPRSDHWPLLPDPWHDQAPGFPSHGADQEQYFSWRLRARSRALSLVRRLLRSHQPAPPEQSTDPSSHARPYQVDGALPVSSSART